MPRFVLLRHECPPALGVQNHWDLMLQRGSTLATWRLLELPTPAAPLVSALRLADHRTAYLEYEGPVSGDRGDVRRVDAGSYAAIEESAQRWVLQFDGAVLSGPAVLQLRDGDEWTLSLG
jgi:hypothetical protein